MPGLRKMSGRAVVKAFGRDGWQHGRGPSPDAGAGSQLGDARSREIALGTLGIGSRGNRIVVRDERTFCPAHEISSVVVCSVWLFNRGPAARYGAAEPSELARFCSLAAIAVEA